MLIKFYFYHLQTYKQVINMNRKVYLMSLIISCPFKEPLASCPFNKYRDISILKLIENTNLLTEKEIILLANEHKECLQNRKKVFEANHFMVANEV